MYIAEFIFRQRERDEDFNRLNRLIDEAARATPGFLGAEAWLKDEGALVNATYYWSTLEALKEFSKHPRHIEAKRQYRRWYEGFHIVVSQVLRSYGDGFINHITPNERKDAAAYRPHE